MSASPDWHPVVPTRSLTASSGVLPVLVRGQALAVWRSTSGPVQAWEDRCPHRGVALSLGRVQGDRLACAYHGWEYAAGSGRCVAIPAMPHQPVPGRVCVNTYPAVERQGMVWVALEDTAAKPPPPPDDSGATTPLRSMAVMAAPAAVDSALARRGFVPTSPCAWRGTWADQDLCLWTLAADAHWCLLHVAAAQAPSADALPTTFAALRRLRHALEHPSD